MKLSLPLWLFYNFSKGIVWISTRLFYRRVEVTNKEVMKEDGPVILVSNHPSTLLDPLNAAVNMPRTIFFLANGGLFKKPFSRWFFSTFYCIPVQRKQDVEEGEELQNENSFAFCDAHLAEGGCLYMAPEGVSFPEQQLRPLKTGMGRIAMSAEKHNDWKLGVKVIPVGLVYSSPMKFRANLLVNIGKPIQVSDFQKYTHEDEFNGVRALTAATAKGMDKLLVNAANFEEEQLIMYLEKLAQNKTPLNLATKFKRTKKHLETIRLLAKNEPKNRKKLEQTVWEYARLLRQNQLDDVTILRSKGAFFDFLLLLLTAPFALLGILNNVLPLSIINKINEKYNVDLSYYSTYKYMGGLVFVPLFYWLQTKLVGWFIMEDWMVWMYIVLIIPSGIFAEWYLKKGRLWRSKMRFNKLDKNTQKIIVEQRRLINEQLALSTY